ncbi:hypothetical protein [Actinoplanes sp. NPDC051411]|uniref:hypothetical protein n=1 Tax=Actinoplanes sp. NPDC051411 TaxID=3155522 RepID=UPI00343F22C5
MTTVEKDWPARLLYAAVRVVPAERRDWGRAMQAELAAIDQPADRWSFAWGCLRASHLLRGTVHLLMVLGTLGALLAWIATADYPPLFWILSTVASVLAAVCWQGRRTGMLGPTGDGVAAWLLRGSGYVIAAGIAVVALAHAHPATLQAADDGYGLLAIAAVAGSFLIGLAAVKAAATRRALVTGAGSVLAATTVWLVVVLVAPPIPAAPGWALVVTAGAAVAAVLTNARNAQESLLAGLLAIAGTMALIFGTVLLLARFGPDSLIPDITPGALPGQHISESRVEIVDPYVLIMILSAVAATALGLAAVVTRRPTALVQREADHAS